MTLRCQNNCSSSKASTVKHLNRPLFTTEFDIPDDFCPTPGSTYLFGVSSEERSEFALQLKRRAQDVRFVELRESDRFVIESDVDPFSRIPLRRRGVLEAFLGALGPGDLYLDMTGLGHGSWAAITRVCVETKRTLRLVYLEPLSYARNATPRQGEVYDLSERIEGIEPLPLFATLDDSAERAICFVPLLGFEGTRFAHMLEEVQPLPRKTVPVIGAPGFHPDYPFNALLGNATSLERSGAQRLVRYVKSNCPFSLYYTLEDIAERYRGEHLKVGLIGTKPHALGAVMFAVVSDASVELVYDHVRRKKNRTTGVEKCLVYGISEFLSEYNLEKLS
jgi:hypothetical protein